MPFDFGEALKYLGGQLPGVGAAVSGGFQYQDAARRQAKLDEEERKRKAVADALAKIQLERGQLSLGEEQFAAGQRVAGQEALGRFESMTAPPPDAGPVLPKDEAFGRLGMAQLAPYNKGVAAIGEEITTSAADEQKRAQAALMQKRADYLQWQMEHAETPEEKRQAAIEMARLKGGISAEFKEMEREATAPERTFAQEDKLRDEFQARAKDFIKVRDAFNRVKASSDSPSAAGDLALIFNYMKILDPGSVVRESEFANAAATGSYGERLKAAASRIIAGKRLSPEMRADFVRRSEALYAKQNETQNQLIEYYKNLATEYGLKGNRITGGFAGGQDAQPAGPRKIGRFTVEVE